MAVGGGIEVTSLQVGSLGPEALLDRLERVVGDAMRLPLSRRALVDQEQLFALLDELRAHLPREVAEARALLRQKEEILQQARWEAEQILAQARENAWRQAEDHQVAQLAEEKGRQILEEAGKAAAEIKEGAYAYAGNVLEQLEQWLLKALEVVRRGKAELRPASERTKAAVAAEGSEDHPASSG